MNTCNIENREEVLKSDKLKLHLRAVLRIIYRAQQDQDDAVQKQDSSSSHAFELHRLLRSCQNEFIEGFNIARRLCIHRPRVYVCELTTCGRTHGMVCPIPISEEVAMLELEPYVTQYKQELKLWLCPRCFGFMAAILTILKLFDFFATRIPLLTSVCTCLSTPESSATPPKTTTPHLLSAEHFYLTRQEFHDTATTEWNRRNRQKQRNDPLPFLKYWKTRSDVLRYVFLGHIHLKEDGTPGSDPETAAPPFVRRRLSGAIEHILLNDSKTFAHCAYYFPKLPPHTTLPVANATILHLGHYWPCKSNPDRLIWEWSSSERLQTLKRAHMPEKTVKLGPRIKIRTKEMLLHHIVYPIQVAFLKEAAFTLETDKTILKEQPTKTNANDMHVYLLYDLQWLLI